MQLKDNNRDLIVTSVGLRPSIPFAIGGVQLSLLGDVAYHRFHKDKAAEGSLVLNNQGVANLYGKELKMSSRQVWHYKHNSLRHSV